MSVGDQPIIIKKIKKVVGGGHHGGAWKVAYADFVTAMMAFFLLMWLINTTTPEQKRGIADYFAPQSIAQTVSGSGGVLGGTGTVMGTINVLGGLLSPGVTAAEVAGIAGVNVDVVVAPGDVLSAGAVKVGLGGGFAATLKASGVSSRLVATGVVALGGNLFLDVAAAPNPGDVYTLIQAGSIVGTFAGLPEGTLINASGRQYRISYQGSRVTITAT